MTEWAIRAYEGAGPIDFDMTFADVAERLGPPPHVFQRDPDSDTEWLYNDLDIRITFDADEKCNLIGFLPGAVGVVRAIRLIGSYHDVVDALKGQGYEVRDEPILTKFGYIWSGNTIFDELGILVRRETRRQETIEDAAAFRRHYWMDDCDQRRRASGNRIVWGSMPGPVSAADSTAQMSASGVSLSDESRDRRSGLGHDAEADLRSVGPASKPVGSGDPGCPAFQVRVAPLDGSVRQAYSLVPRRY